MSFWRPTRHGVGVLLVWLIVDVGSALALPSFEIVDRKLDDEASVAPGIHLSLVVSGEATPADLRELLQKVYQDEVVPLTFSQHSGPAENVWIFVFSSREHVKAGWSGAIARLDKHPLSPETKIEVNEGALAHLHDAPSSRFGLSEAKRMELAKMLGSVEDRAFAEADRKYPDGGPRWLPASQALVKKYRAEACGGFRLTMSQCESVEAEAEEKNWPSR